MTLTFQDYSRLNLLVPLYSPCMVSYCFLRLIYDLTRFITDRQIDEGLQQTLDLV